jgi:dTDP-4-dehydrorhamnose reductase
MAEICNEIGSALLHISTDYVFAGESDGPYLETDTTAPSGVYGASKLAGEQAIAALCPRHIILRTSWVFGRHGNNFVKTMIRLAQTRDSLGVVSDQVGAPTSAAGIAEALLRIVDRLVSGEIRWGTYHYTGAPHTTWHGFADSIFADADDRGMLPSAMNLRAIATSEYPTPAKRPANSRLNCDKIKQEFGIQPDNWRNQLGAVLDSLHGVDQ